MKTYKEQVTVTKVVQEVLCNFCKEPAIKESIDSYHHANWSCEGKISWQNHGSFPGQSSGSCSFDVCQNCYDNKIKPLMVLPVNSVTYDEDTGTKLIEP